MRRGVVLTAGAGLYALLYALCSQIDQAHTVQAALVLPRFLLAFPVALAALLLLFKYVLPQLTCAGPERAEKRFCTSGAFILLGAVYGGMFLIFYPGSFMYDTQRQVTQIAYHDYDMFHPLLHTLLIRACLSAANLLGSMEKCAALYSVIQLTMTSACFAGVCASISRMYGRRAARVSLGFFALYPAHMAFASNCTKDTLFSAFLALFFALCFEGQMCGGLSGWHRALRLVSGVLACLLRNNMIYAMAVWCVYLLLFCRRCRQLAVCGALSVVLAFCGQAALQYATHARDGNIVEMMSVPIQQLSRARLVAPECFTPEEAALMDEVFVDSWYGASQPLYEFYEPTLADPVKNYLDEALVKARFSELAAMWLHVGQRCPGVYLDAFLELALPSLYPYSRYRGVHPYIETGLQPGVVTAPYGQPPMTQPARFEGIRRFLQTHIYETGADSVPLLRWLMNTGAVFWFLLMLLLYALYDGCGKRLALLLLPVLLYGTYLLGPVMQGRYLYPFVCVLPLFVFRKKQAA